MFFLAIEWLQKGWWHFIFHQSWCKFTLISHSKSYSKKSTIYVAGVAVFHIGRAKNWQKVAY